MKVGDIINIVFQHGGSELMEKIEAELEQWAINFRSIFNVNFIFPLVF
jgi:hypothetical protein